jgi:hypothetical protein
MGKSMVSCRFSLSQSIEKFHLKVLKDITPPSISKVEAAKPETIFDK